MLPARCLDVSHHEEAGDRVRRDGAHLEHSCVVWYPPHLLQKLPELHSSLLRALPGHCDVTLPAIAQVSLPT